MSKEKLKGIGWIALAIAVFVTAIILGGVCDNGFF